MMWGKGNSCRRLVLCLSFLFLASLVCRSGLNGIQSFDQLLSLVSTFSKEQLSSDEAKNDILAFLFTNQVPPAVFRKVIGANPGDRHQALESIESTYENILNVRKAFTRLCSEGASCTDAEKKEIGRWVDSLGFSQDIGKEAREFLQKLREGAANSENIVPNAKRLLKDVSLFPGGKWTPGVSLVPAYDNDDDSADPDMRAVLQASLQEQQGNPARVSPAPLGGEVASGSLNDSEGDASGVTRALSQNGSPPFITPWSSGGGAAAGDPNISLLSPASAQELLSPASTASPAEAPHKKNQVAAALWGTGAAAAGVFAARRLWQLWNLQKRRKRAALFWKMRPPRTFLDEEQDEILRDLVVSVPISVLATLGGIYSYRKN